MYKRQAGDQFTEGGKPVEGKRDICDIYAIMYETSVSVPTLDGTNAFTSPNLVSMARIKDAKETDEWTYFKLPFTTLDVYKRQPIQNVRIRSFSHLY